MRERFGEPQAVCRTVADMNLLSGHYGEESIGDRPPNSPRNFSKVYQRLHRLNPPNPIP
jgi:hypothetical protein